MERIGTHIRSSFGIVFGTNRPWSSPIIQAMSRAIKPAVKRRYLLTKVFPRRALLVWR